MLVTCWLRPSTSSLSKQDTVYTYGTVTTNDSMVAIMHVGIRRAVVVAIVDVCDDGLSNVDPDDSKCILHIGIGRWSVRMEITLPPQQCQMTFRLGLLQSFEFDALVGAAFDCLRFQLRWLFSLELL